MILCIGTTPATQRVMIFQRLAVDRVNRAVTTLDGIAGKSVNVAKVLKALGEEPLAAGFLGGERGERLRAGLVARGIAQEFITVTAPTRECLTVIDRSNGTVTELVEESRAVAPGDYERLEQIIRRRLADCQAVIMSGSLTPGGPAGFYRRCTELAHQAGVLPVVDTQGAPLLEALAAGPGLVKPNRFELAATVGRELKDEAAVREAMRELHRRGARRVVVTNGKEATLAYDGESFWRSASAPIMAVNPIGSGDAFTAALVWRLVKGEHLGEACRWAAAAGGANALTLMAGELEGAEVERLADNLTSERLD